MGGLKFLLGCMIGSFTGFTVVMLIEGNTTASGIGFGLFSFFIFSRILLADYHGGE